MTNSMVFEEWKKELMLIAKLNGFTQAAIDSLDWSAWKESYYDDGLTPAGAMAEEMSSG